MKTRNLYTGLTLILAVISQSISSASPVLNKNNHHSAMNSDLELFVENQMDIENWMTDPNEFDFNHAFITDNEIAIEDWMTKEFSGLMVPATAFEQEIILEDWMTKIFELSDQHDTYDEELEIEPWMSKIISL